MTKYLNTYNKLILKVQLTTPNGYYENHHIIPKSLGGIDDMSNMVKLTAKQHYVAHHLLWRHYKKIDDFESAKKMLYAFWAMSTQKKDGRRYINASNYEVIRNEYSKIRSIATSGSNNPNYGNPTGYKHSEATIIKMTRKGVEHPMYGKHHSDDSKEKMSAAMKGRKLTDEHKAKIVNYGSANGMSRPVHCIELNITFNTATEAIKYINKGSIKICEVCRGRRKKAGGYTWKYATSE